MMGDGGWCLKELDLENGKGYYKSLVNEMTSGKPCKRRNRAGFLPAELIQYILLGERQ